MKYKIVILAGFGLILIIAALAFVFGRVGGGSEFSGELKIWSFEPPAVWEELIAAFETQHKNLRITYSQKNPSTYENELLNALAAGTGPDIFFIHHQWLLKHADKIAPLPENFISPAEFGTTFVDVASKDLVRDGRVWALPFYVDTLAFYYNKTLFNAAGVPLPPATWEEFSETVTRLTQRDSSGNIVRSGAALGTASNVAYAGDIVAALMLQTGTIMIDPVTGQAIFDRGVTLDNRFYEPGKAALTFYTDFSDPAKSVYTWNRGFLNSREAFEKGETAIYFGYAKDRPQIAESGISFAVSPFPQVKKAGEDPSYIPLTYADYWAGAVSKSSPNREAAWNFLLFATSRNAVFNFLSKAGLPTARRDLIELQSQDPRLAVFARQSLTADSWLEPDPQSVDQIFNTMIDDVVLGRANAEEAIRQAAIEVNELWER